MDHRVPVLDVRCAPAIEWSAVQLKKRAVGKEDASGLPAGGRRHVDPAAPVGRVAVCNGRGDEVRQRPILDAQPSALQTEQDPRSGGSLGGLGHSCDVWDKH